ncbi:MAG: PIG-L family deacetylase [Rudaea sp.]|uniref:PIG-L deacetylase family protein n=1 Tax=unclassified Rudaea TaxID=2627037 RepID=UPI0010F4697F|nr:MULTISPECIES: PIG-L family deacetylase [unclassified Rudaea]MBN8884148.1 PIG-L family deacetylase [Rudaea sp.]MBR0347735.1 PIG-L family deacetylase [Rudaea sp.]
MSDVIRLDAGDRVLVVAPHPDDESIASGGLLLAAREAGAARRVVTLTDGDNNPWPQRWIEKRWRIDAVARARWGARRRAEAQAALDLLGVAPGERAFLGLPDTGLTSLLLGDADKLVGALRRQIVDFRPSHLAFPALRDRHPDHSAAHIAARIAASATGSAMRLLAYRVHGDDDASVPSLIELNESQREAKRRAIASHHSQVALSGKRFLAFATPTESYGDAAAAPRADHPLEATYRSGEMLRLRARKQKLRGDLQVLLLFANADGDIRAWRLPFDTSGRRLDVRETRDDRVVATAQWQDDGEAWSIALALPDSLSPHLGFVKLGRSRPGLVVFDRYGWQAIHLPDPT